MFLTRSLALAPATFPSERRKRRRRLPHRLASALRLPGIPVWREAARGPGAGLAAATVGTRGLASSRSRLATRPGGGGVVGGGGGGAAESWLSRACHHIAPGRLPESRMACRCERSVGFAVRKRSIISRTLAVRCGDVFVASLMATPASARARPLWANNAPWGATQSVAANRDAMPSSARAAAVIRFHIGPRGSSVAMEMEPEPPTELLQLTTCHEVSCRSLRAGARCACAAFGLETRVTPQARHSRHGRPTNRSGTACSGCSMRVRRMTLRPRRRRWRTARTQPGQTCRTW